jgi:hypothetical protein
MNQKALTALCPVDVCGVKLTWSRAGIVIVTLVGVLFTLLSPSAAGQWIPFESNGNPTSVTTVEVRQKSLDSIMIEISCPGLSLWDVTSKDTAWVVPMILNEDLSEQTGLPLLPVVRRTIATPEYESVSVTITITDSVVVPLDAKVMLCDQPSPLGPDQRIEPDMHWEHMSAYPLTLADITGEARIRDLRVLCLSVYPVRYMKGSSSLICYSDIQVKLRFTGSSPSLAIRGTGPFENICERSIVGYDGPQLAHSMLAQAPGQWRRCTGETPLQCCIDHGTDYVILTPTEFFYDPWIESLAAKRASYNNFNVSVVNVDSLSAEPSDAAIQSFISALYDAATAAHMPDGHLAFVLLAGGTKIRGVRSFLQLISSRRILILVRTRRMMKDTPGSSHQTTGTRTWIRLANRFPTC